MMRSAREEERREGESLLQAAAFKFADGSRHPVWWPPILCLWEGGVHPGRAPRQGEKGKATPHGSPRADNTLTHQLSLRLSLLPALLSLVWRLGGEGENERMHLVPANSPKKGKRKNVPGLARGRERGWGACPRLGETVGVVDGQGKTWRALPSTPQPTLPTHDRS